LFYYSNFCKECFCRTALRSLSIDELLAGEPKTEKFAATGQQHAEGNRQIEAGSFLPDIGRARLIVIRFPYGQRKPLLQIAEGFERRDRSGQLSLRR